MVQRKKRNSLRLESALDAINKSLCSLLGSRSLLLPTACPNTETDGAQQRTESKVLILDGAAGDDAKRFSTPEQTAT